MNNYSQFSFDGLWRNTKIVETVSGSVTSTKQFMWAAYSRLEERDASGGMTKKFFGGGQINSSTKYFNEREHLGSVRERTDNSGSRVAEYAYDPFGRVTKISETVAPDFGYAGYYLHSRSGLNVTYTRSYSGPLGRWVTRDIVEENDGANLYRYCKNSPICLVDPEGTTPPGSHPIPGWMEYVTKPYGNWGGWCWANGGWCSEMDDFPQEGDPDWKPPVNPRDKCYYEHDVCLRKAAKIKDPQKRKCARRQCDKDVSNCLKSVQQQQYGNAYGNTSWQQGWYSGENSPNNNIGGYFP